MIYCLAGEALLVYEDQGPPFVFAAGDCVPQPPEIRHRVLQASDGFEVIEIGCPALHETCADHELTLPNQPIRPERIFNGQRFAHHIARAALWQSADGLEFRDTGIAHATGGLARARVLRPSADFSTQHQGEFLFYFVLRGELGLAAPIHGKHLLSAGDSCVIPADTEFILNTGQGLELLEVALPAAQPQNFPLRNIS
jgi:mannose-6-phosphate isomerase-like protein (cupin superfamily)